MSKLSKIITGIAMAAAVAAVAVVPVKADAAYDANVKMLEQIAAQTTVSAQARDAVAAAGLERAQANFDASRAIVPGAQADLARVQAASLAQLQAALDAYVAAIAPAQANLAAVQAANITSGKALLDSIADQTAKSAAWTQAVANKGLGK